MYEQGQRIVIRDKVTGHEEVAVVEEVLLEHDGAKLRVKDPRTGTTRTVNPVEQNILEHLED